MSERIAFIGLGIMGGPMAGHLLNNGAQLTVNTRTRARAKELLDRGAKWAETPAQAAAEADVVFVCVPDTPDVESVVLGKDGILAAARPGLVAVDHSTISPTATKKMNEALNAEGAQLLDAPVSGGDVGAQNATLSIMVGGDASSFERVRPLLVQMGKTITYCGPSGSGQLTKLVNQILVTINNLAVSEALTFAQQSGLDPQKTIAAVSGGAAGSWQLSNLGPKMIAGNFRPGFMIKLQHKDLRLAIAAAKGAGLDLPALDLVYQLFDQGLREGRGNEGTQALFALVKERATQPK
jgi:3-hydroxyisobutyrate dehydrogenase